MKANDANKTWKGSSVQWKPQHSDPAGRGMCLNLDNNIEQVLSNSQNGNLWLLIFAMKRNFQME